MDKNKWNLINLFVGKQKIRESVSACYLPFVQITDIPCYKDSVREKINEHNSVTGRLLVNSPLGSRNYVFRVIVIFERLAPN